MESSWFFIIPQLALGLFETTYISSSVSFRRSSTNNFIPPPHTLYDLMYWLCHSLFSALKMGDSTVELHQLVQQSHHAEIPIQNSQSHSKCILVRNKSYCTYRLQHPLRKVIHEKINKHHKKLEAHPNPLLEPRLQPINTRKLKICWPLHLQGT